MTMYYSSRDERILAEKRKEREAQAVKTNKKRKPKSQPRNLKRKA